MKFDLKPDLAGSLARLRNPELADAAAKATLFPVPLMTQRRKDIAKDRDKRRAKRCIKAENAGPLVAEFPASPDSPSLHAYLPGDFVFCDVLTVLAATHGAPRSIDIATLSLSLKNVEALATLLQLHPQLVVRLSLSVYFQGTNKQIFGAVLTRLVPFGPRFHLSTGRIHAKTILVDYPDRPLVLTGSSNLRSSQSIEFLTVECCPDLFAFHVRFFEEFRAACQSARFDGFEAHTPPEE